LLFLDKDLDEYIQIKTNEPDIMNNEKIIHIKCNYLSSCFGAALSLLNQCVGKDGKSIRKELAKIQSEERLLLIESKKLNDFTLPVPKELHALISFLMQNGKLKPNIFLTSGNPVIAKQVRDKIDSRIPLSVEDGDDPYTVATVLIDFL